MVKRKALLIGASGGDLPGVKVDVNGYKEYLMSNKGGAWEENEIKVICDKPKDIIKTQLTLVKLEQNDFVFTVFTGHGAYSTIRDERFVCDNEDNNIYESELLGLSSKQVLILDSCANYIHEEFSESRAMICLENASDSERKYYREKYDKEISQCPNQLIKLYSCSENQSSSDNKMRGGVYSYNLIKVLKQYSGNRLDFKTANEEVSKIVNRLSGGNQTPDGVYPKLYSSEILPASVNLNRGW